MEENENSAGQTSSSVSPADSSHDWKPLEDFLGTFVDEKRPLRKKLIGEIFKAAIKLVRENPGTLNMKITATVLKELRFSFKLFYPHRFTPKITMFGSARVPPGTELYQLSKQFAMDAVKREYMIITGGGPGIMAAGNEGAEAKGGFGLNIRLPVEQTPNPFIDSDRMLIHYKYFFIRKLFLVKEASAFVFFPGGFGTFDEAFEVLTLMQTGKSNVIPVVMLEPEGFGFWESLVRFMNENLEGKGFISPSDRNLYHVFHTPKEALDHIEFFYSNYHSMRNVGKNLVIRVKHKPSEATVERMNEEFKSLTTRGPIVASAALPEEENEPELKDLHRLVFPFERNDYGTLRRLVDFLNDNPT